MPGSSAVELENVSAFKKSQESTVEARAAVGIAALKRFKDERESKVRVPNGPIDLAASLTKMYFSKNYRKPEAETN